LSFRAIVGTAYATNPFDSFHNPSNHAYSTGLNAYLVVGTGLWFRLSDHWWGNGTLSFQHFSNGGLRLPNAGIDWPTVGIILSYQKNPAPYYSVKRKKENHWKENSIRWGATIFGNQAKIKNEDGNERFYPIAGIGFQGSKQVGSLNALNFGAEIFTDPGHAKEFKKDSVSVSPIRAGMLFGHEFLLGKFTFSQRLGLYFINQMPYNRLYQRWGLNYQINNHWSIGTSLLSHRQVANFFDIRASYSWQKRGRQ